MLSRCGHRCCLFPSLRCRFAVATPEELAANNDDCAICWDSMQSARKLPCGHLFHKYVSGAGERALTAGRKGRVDVSENHSRMTGSCQPSCDCSLPVLSWSASNNQVQVMFSAAVSTCGSFYLVHSFPPKLRVCSLSPNEY